MLEAARSACCARACSGVVVCRFGYSTSTKPCKRIHELPEPQSSGNALVIAILVLILVSSAVFWLGIAPNL